MSMLNSPTTLTLTEAYIAFQLFSAAVQSLPQPVEFGGVWYKAFYNFLSIIAADFKSFFASKGTPTGFTTATATVSTTEITQATLSK